MYECCADKKITFEDEKTLLTYLKTESVSQTIVISEIVVHDDKLMEKV